MAESTTFYNGEPLPVGSKGRLSSGWWGMIVVIATEASLFAYLLFSYYYVAAQVVGPWPPGGAPDLTLAIPGTVVLMLGSVTMWWGERGVRNGRIGQLLIGLGASILLGLAFIALEAIEWAKKDVSLTSNVYGSLYYTITGFHMLHVAVGVLMLVAVLVWAARGRYTRTDHLGMTTTGYYWHFVDAVWLVVFFSFYLWPRLA